MYIESYEKCLIYSALQHIQDIVSNGYSPQVLPYCDKVS